MESMRIFVIIMILFGFAFSTKQNYRLSHFRRFHLQKDQNSPTKFGFFPRNPFCSPTVCHKCIQIIHRGLLFELKYIKHTCLKFVQSSCCLINWWKSPKGKALRKFKEIALFLIERRKLIMQYIRWSFINLFWTEGSWTKSR